MIKLKGNSTYIKNVQAPTVLEIQVISGMQNGSVTYNPNHFCFPSNVINLDLNPSAYINRTNSIVNDMNDYIHSILKNFITSCYNGAAFDELKGTLNGDSFKVFDGLTTDLRKALDDRTLLGMLGSAAAFGTDGIFSMVIGGINFDFENGFMRHLFNEKLDWFAGLFMIDNLYRSVYYNDDSANRYKYSLSGGPYKSFKLKTFYNILVEIFFFYAFQARRNEIMAGKLFDLYAYASSRNLRGEIYVWDNNLEQYMSYIPRRENKWVVGDLCPAINVNHNMSEGFTDLNDEFRTDGGEKYNPIERRKISFISESTGNSNGLTFITMPPKRLHYYKQDVMLSSYNAYRSYANNNGTFDAVGITLYTTNKNQSKSIAVNNIIYSDTVRKYLEKDYAAVEALTYDDLLFNSIQYDLNNPEIEFRCRVAYFTRGGGRTLKNENDLKTTKIPKEKRDPIFEALCDLCYELDVEPQDVLDKLDVYFKKLYKKPTELL
jgi:hypothetical protein